MVTVSSWSPGSRPLVIAVCGLPFEAAIAAGPGVLTVCGPGPLRVAARLAALLDGGRGARADARADLTADSLADPLAEPPADARADPPANAPADASAGLPFDARFAASAAARDGAHTGRCWAGIISFGCAGALDPALAPGACVVADGVLTTEGVLAADPRWTSALLSRLPHARAGLLAGLDRPLASAADKLRLWRASGACAVDMESQAAAIVAWRLGLPFAACRVVLDPAWRSLPPCALAALREDGSTALAPLLSGLSADPRQLASVCALAREAWLARRALRRVRGQVGVAFALPGAGE